MDQFGLYFSFSLGKCVFSIPPNASFPTLTWKRSLVRIQYRLPKKCYKSTGYLLNIQLRFVECEISMKNT
jgi:hypothetical protein